MPSQSRVDHIVDQAKNKGSQQRGHQRRRCYVFWLYGPSIL